MSQIIAVLVFGFPAVIASLLIAGIGVWKEKFWLVLIGAVLFVPFSYYLFGSPGLIGPPALVLLGYFGSAVAVYAKKKNLASVLLLPALLVSLWVAAAGLFVQFQ
jgi:hypothetical protein